MKSANGLDFSSKNLDQKHINLILNITSIGQKNSYDYRGGNFLYNGKSRSLKRGPCSLGE